MAWTRATGIVWPSAIRSARERLRRGQLARPADRRPRSAAAAVRTVKSAGVTRSSSSQATGKDTGTPGRMRGLYAATTVAPPARVESRNTLPSRSSRMNAVVVSAGSSRSARAASARVAAATSSLPRRPRSGTNTCTPFAPLVLTAPARPAPARASRTSRAAWTASRNVVRRTADRCRAPGRWGGPSAGPDQRGVVLHGALVGEPQQGAAVVAERVGHLAPGGLRPQRHGPHPRRGVLGHVLLHERRLAAQHPDHRQRPVPQLGDDPVARPRPGSRPGRAWSPPRRRTAAGRGWSAVPRPAPHRR